MDWSRAKTILIICLFAVNIFLFGTYMTKENENREEKARLREEVCKVLDGQGISISEDKIPDDSLIIGHATVKANEDGAAMAGALLGEVTESSGENNVAYSGKNGNMMMFNDSFSIVYESGEEIKSEERAIDLALEIASKLGFKTDEKNVRSETYDGGYSVRLPQILSGTRVFGADMDMRISSTGSVLANGRFIGQGRLFGADGETLEISAILLDFADIIKAMGKEKITVSEVEYGYSVKYHTAGTVYLVPTLRAVTDGGTFHVGMEDGRLLELN